MDNNDLVSSISSNAFTDNAILSAADKKAINKCITSYEEISGDSLVNFSALTKEVLTAREFGERNSKYADIPLASKVYVFTYKNKEAMFAIIHKDGKKVEISKLNIEASYKKERVYYTTCIYALVGIGNSAIKSFLNSLSKKKKDEPEEEPSKKETDVKESAKFQYYIGGYNK